MTEPLSKNLKILFVLMAIGGIILFPVCCMLFGNNIISAFSEMNALTSNANPSHEVFQNVSNNVIVASFQFFAIFLSLFSALFGWIMIFMEYELNKKYRRYLNIIPIIGGIICLIGLNIPSNETGFITINSILFSVGGTILVTGIAIRLGFFNKPKDVITS